jgi:hypothetical protein
VSLGPQDIHRASTGFPHGLVLDEADRAHYA